MPGGDGAEEESSIGFAAAGQHQQQAGADLGQTLPGTGRQRSQTQRYGGIQLDHCGGGADDGPRLTVVLDQQTHR